MSSYNGCWWTCFNPSWVGRWTNLHCSFMCCCSGTSATPAILSLEQNFPGFGARKWLVICRDILLLAGENLPQFPVMLWDSSYHHFLKAECSVSLFCFPCNCLQIHKTLLLSQLSFVDAMLSVYYSYNLICICYKSIWAMWSSLYESVWWNGDFFFFCETQWRNMICPILVGFVIVNEWVYVVCFCNSYLVLIIMADYLYANTMVIIWTWVLESLLFLPFVWSLKMGHWNLQQSDFYVSGRQQRSGFWWSQGKLHWLEHI